MPADNVLAEALARIEHKLDLLLALQMGKTPGMKKQLGEAINCPVCGRLVEYQVDQINKVIVRKCGCKTGLQAPLDLNAFAVPAEARKGQADGREDREDGSNSDAGGRRRPLR